MCWRWLPPSRANLALDRRPESVPEPLGAWLPRRFSTGPGDGALAEPLDERPVRLGLDHAGELGPEGRHEARTVDQHVVHLPPAAVQMEAVIDPDLAPPWREHFGPHRREGAVDRFTRVDDPLTRVRLDAAHVRALEKVGEERDELRLFRVGARGPVPGKRASRDLGEVEQLMRDPPDLGSAVGLGTTAGRARLEHADDAEGGGLH